MFKRFGTFFKIDNNSINNTNKNNTSFAKPYAENTNVAQAFDNTTKGTADFNESNGDNSNSIYHGYIARHRRLSAEIDRKHAEK